MKLFKNMYSYIVIGSMLFIISLLFYHLYTTFKKNGIPELYQTTAIGTRTITHMIKATGMVEPKDILKIGSLIPGVIHKMYVEENDIVKKGTLLAEIDDGRANNDVRVAQANAYAAHARYTYQQRNYERNKLLHKNEFISDDEFDRITQNYTVAQAEMLRTKAQYDQRTLEFNNKTIIAPDDGIVIEKVGAEGETVTLASPPTLLYIIAKDITKMEAKIEIDESVVGDLHTGITSKLYFDTYPYKTFSGTIEKISNAPIVESGATSYQAIIPLDNNDLLFKPGMNVDATIVIDEKENVIAVPGYVFSFPRATMKTIAQASNMHFSELPTEEQKKYKEQENVQFVWVVSGNTITERAVTLGITDAAFFEVIDGLEQGEKIITDIAEPDAMKEFFERFFGKGLQ